MAGWSGSSDFLARRPRSREWPGAPGIPTTPLQLPTAAPHVMTPKEQERNRVVVMTSPAVASAG